MGRSSRAAASPPRRGPGKTSRRDADSPPVLRDTASPPPGGRPYSPASSPEPPLTAKALALDDLPRPGGKSAMYRDAYESGTEDPRTDCEHTEVPSDDDDGASRRGSATPGRASTPPRPSSRSSTTSRRAPRAPSAASTPDDAAPAARNNLRLLSFTNVKSVVCFGGGKDVLDMVAHAPKDVSFHVVPAVRCADNGADGQFGTDDDLFEDAHILAYDGANADRVRPRLYG
ncbi:hypothetical protein JL720_16863 [Aureococcus anophagefferens]|nr:hypothetical protein JL720_16863 [Aureococcus anophagefferens]